ncbi:hypothetical protein G6F57_002580 [Rhizopus arrhizus]|uniref:Phytanoyl-CoA dioxygenase n=1 Tax=Rhizopus oryzae TaxID=64495 RepID=A0A9P6XDC5_RHIOR|nr:hypothetical protein G6F23_005806 [Rhizopus arrhizus]KAG1395044.1 hypothetical protein G6F58_012017 [Rhizopus delemar]KAG0768348.1 hypothetical protein G6F24_002017 [Rhizopus arrhizus]KAG0795665.1 hypothetical protein G6F21_001930 [Rhizopus arrhizus]KAG0816417.1 hypothetical protein G6F20_003223 [Rhizopus arrhizus]
MITDINNIPIDEALKNNGYVIVDNLIPQEMFKSLREACDRVVEKARKGEWKHRRLVGTQFPPWTEGTDVWGVQHLLHPELKEPIFTEWYGSVKLLEAVQQLLHAKHEELQLESDFDLTWHRDAIPAETPETEEKEKLAIPHYGTQWNTALYDDACLYVVPDSHRRVRTAKEREITIHDPKSSKMPNQLRVELKAGQTVFYDNNILHRAAYLSSQKRATLHASMGTIEGGHYRAGCILQHGLEWMKTDDFKHSLTDSLSVPYANLITMADKAGISRLEAKPIHEK